MVNLLLNESVFFTEVNNITSLPYG